MHHSVCTTNVCSKGPNFSCGVPTLGATGAAETEAETEAEAEAERPLALSVQACSLSYFPLPSILPFLMIPQKNSTLWLLPHRTSREGDRFLFHRCSLMQHALIQQNPPTGTATGAMHMQKY